MPGVVVTTAARSGLSTPLRAASGQFFAVGLSERGPVNKAVLLQNMSDYQKFFGTRQAFGYLYDSVKLYFDEGGTQCYAARVVGSGATKGTVTLMDQSVSSPPSTLKFDAANAGIWSSDVSVIVADGSVADSVDVTVKLNDGSVVESYRNLTSPAAVASAFANSVLVVVTDLGSVSAAPANLPALGTFTLTSGGDDRTSVTSSDYVTALALFTEDLGDGAVAIPGLGTAVHSGIVAHCASPGMNRVGILSAGQGAAESDLVTAASNVISATNGDYAGLFDPWVKVSDGGTGSITVPPEGYVAACRARAALQEGPWRVPAGAIAIATSITGLTTYYDRDTANTLDAAQVSVIRSIKNSVRLYGWRSLSADQTNFQFLSARDTLNRAATLASDALEEYAFQTVDPKGQLLSKIASALVTVASPMASAGGLYSKVDSNGNQIDPGWSVDVSATENPIASLANNLVQGALRIRVSPTAAMIEVSITKVGLTGSL